MEGWLKKVLLENGHKNLHRKLVYWPAIGVNKIPLQMDWKKPWKLVQTWIKFVKLGELNGL